MSEPRDEAAKRASNPPSSGAAEGDRGNPGTGFPANVVAETKREALRLKMTRRPVGASGRIAKAGHQRVNDIALARPGSICLPESAEMADSSPRVVLAAQASTTT